MQRKEPITLFDFMSLNRDIQIMILNYLPLADFINLEKVSIHFKNLCYSPTFWQPKIARDFPELIPDLVNGIKKASKSVYIAEEIKEYEKLSEKQKHIFELVRDNNLAELIKLQLVFTDIGNVFTTSRLGPVTYAARLKHFNILNYFYELIKDYYNNHTEDINQNILLTWAVRCYQPIDVVEELMIQYPNWKAYKNRVQSSVADHACQVNNVEALNFILGKGYPLNEKQGANQISLLYSVCQDGYFDCVKVLVDRGIDINVVSIDDNSTSLLAAVEYGHLDCARYLLDHGADASICRRKGETPGIYGSPLFLAAYFGHKDLVKLLLNYQPDFDAHGGKNDKSIRYTPEGIAFKKGFHEIEKILVDARNERRLATKSI